MNPKIDEQMTWKDYSTTAAQWLSILGGIAWAICAGLGVATGGVLPGVMLAVTGLAGGRRGSLLEDVLGRLYGGIRGGRLPLLICAAIGLLALHGCATDHPLLQADSLRAAMQVATPYILDDCQAIEMYPGYRFAWADVSGDGDPDFMHGFGGIIGGCGKYAKIACNVDTGGEVTCEVIEVLKTE